jgi:hypothetical protein
MLNPISSAIPPDCIIKTRRIISVEPRRPPLASSTTLPGTCASMVRARSMQSADPVHMSLENSYVPAATKILSTALLLTAAVSSATLLTETWFSFRPCRTRGAEGSRPSFVIDAVGMLATAMDSWTRLRSVAALMCICRAARSGLVGHGPVTPHTPGCFVGAARGRRGCRGVHVSLEGGVRCRVGHSGRARVSGGWCAAQAGPCAAVRLCVWAWRGGVAKAKSACRTRAVAAVEAASSPPPATSGATHCVCVRHTARRTLRGVQLARQGLGAGCGREGSPHALRGQSLPPPHPRVCACDRRAGGGRAPWSQRDASSQRNRKFADGGVTSGRKSSNWVSRAGRPGGEPEACVSTGARIPREGASAQRAQRRTRPVKKKKKKGGRPKGTDSRGGAPDARPKTHALQNDTLRPEPAPAGMLQGLPIAAERRAVGWGNGERRWRGRAPLAGAAGARAGRTWPAAVQRRSPAGDGGRESFRWGGCYSADS